MWDLSPFERIGAAIVTTWRVWVPVLGALVVLVGGVWWTRRQGR